MFSLSAGGDGGHGGLCAPAVSRRGLSSSAGIRAQGSQTGKHPGKTSIRGCVSMIKNLRRWFSLRWPCLCLVILNQINSNDALTTVTLFYGKVLTNSVLLKVHCVIRNVLNCKKILRTFKLQTLKDNRKLTRTCCRCLGNREERSEADGCGAHEAGERHRQLPGRQSRLHGTGSTAAGTHCLKKTGSAIQNT